MSPFVAVIDGFNRSQISYVVVGGFATVLHGHARLTTDIDFAIAIDSSNATRALDALARLNFVPRFPVNPNDFTNESFCEQWTREKEIPILPLFKRDNPLLGVNLFVRYPMDYNQMLRNAKAIDLGGVSIRTCGIDDLINLKSAAGRPLDLDDVRVLKEIRDAS